METSSGMWPSSMRLRTKPNSVSEADGKPTSISLKPMAQSILNICIFLSAFIGSNRAWLPSRRSVLIHTGGVGDGAARPLAVGELDRREGGVFGVRGGNHVRLLNALAMAKV